MELSFINYFVQHAFAITMSLPYFIGLALFGSLLVLRRATLFGMALSQAAQVSFVLGLGWHFASHQEDAFSFINRSGAKNLAYDLYHLDLYVFPLTFLFLLPFLLLARRPLRVVESGLTLALILFLNLLPLANRLVGGSERTLLSVYFSEILYTPPQMFWHYLPYLLSATFVFGVFYRVFVLVVYDPVLAKLNGIAPQKANVLFYLLAGLAIAAAVRVIGIYLTMVALVAPAMAALLFAHSLTQLFFLSALLSVLSTLLGFGLAFALPDYPSEPLVVSAFAMVVALLWLVHRIVVYYRLWISVDKIQQKVSK